MDCIKRCLELGKNQSDTDDWSSGCKLRPGSSSNFSGLTCEFNREGAREVEQDLKLPLVSKLVRQL